MGAMAADTYNNQLISAGEEMPEAATAMAAAMATVRGNSNVANGGDGDGNGAGDGNGNSDSSGRRRRRRHNGCSDNLTDHFTRGEGIIK
jgi:hypothetical protein